MSSLLMLSVSSLMITLHQQVVAELKQAQLLIQANRINEYLVAEIKRAGFAVSQSASVVGNQLAIHYKLGECSECQYQGLLIFEEDNKLKVCNRLSANPISLTQVCEQSIKFSMLSDKLIVVESFIVSEVTSRLYSIDYALRLKGDTQLEEFSLLASARGADGAE
nr:hypothetical protein [Vibrio gallicus]